MTSGLPASSLSLRELEEFDPRSPTRPGERRFLCPLCGADKPRDSAHRSLTLNTSSGAWMCWRCEAKGKLVEWHEDRPLPERRREKLRRAFSLDEVSLRKDTPLKPGEWRRTLKGLQPLDETTGADYLLSRGLTIEIAHEAGTRFSRDFYGRPAVVFPLRDKQGQFVAAQGRYLADGSGPKARTVGDKKLGAFTTSGLWEAIAGGAPLVVCEAPIDALSLALCGFPALALCGKDGPDWLPRACAFQAVALAFDADEAGDGGADKLAAQIEPLGAKPFRLRPEGGKDWNELLQVQGRDTLSDWLALRLLG